MKKIFKSMMFLAAAATALTACNKEADIQETGRTGETETLHFYAIVNDAETKATLTTEDEKTFKAAWEEGDKMDIEVSGGIIALMFSQPQGKGAISNLTSLQIGLRKEPGVMGPIIRLKPASFSGPTVCRTAVTMLLSTM